ncbi:MAG: hypothetical protein ABIE70_11040 [bacterium]
MKHTITIVSIWLLLLAFVTTGAIANEYQGTIRAGYTFTDIEGNQGVNQPTFNLYEGMAFSLEQFRYQWADGMKLTAGVYNPMLNNRRLNLGLIKSGFGGVSLNHSSYRRTYDFDGGYFTRRRSTSGSAWVRPIKQVKLFGGIDYVGKNGSTIDFIEPASGDGLNQTDFTHQTYRGGVEVKYNRSYGRLEFNVADFNNDRDTTTDRTASRFRMTFYSPVPQHEQFVLSGGFQRFVNRMENRADTLAANTVWGAVQHYCRRGYQVRYSFMFDRARRTGDLTATDNVLHAVHIGKTWLGRAGITAGYGHRVNDDAARQRSADEYSLTGWVKPVEALLVRGGMDFESNVVDSGRSLTGDQERARHYISARYTFEDASLRLSLEDRRRDNDDIGSSTEFTRISADLSVANEKYGDLSASYSFGSGDYDNAAGEFEYTEHTLSGEVWSREYQRLQAGFRGTYYRTRRDVDIESFSLEFTGRYGIHERTRLELVYAAHNFDDLNDPSEFYSRYFTANVVTAVLVYEL